jgi:hypothetical protein
MVIKNKDGTPVKLRGPNKFIKSQKIWGAYKLHNCHWGSESALDQTEVVPKTIDDFEIKQKEDGFEELLVAEPPKVQEETEREEIQIIEGDYGDSVALAEGEIQILCLPALENVDEVYDEVRGVRYGSKFIFRGQIVHENDFSIAFWTQTEGIGRDSIIYPKNMAKRWWKVLDNEPKGPGYVYSAMPSDIQPDFS